MDCLALHEWPVLLTFIFITLENAKLRRPQLIGL